MNAKDVERLADELQTLVGAHLQDVWLNNSTIALRIFGTKNVWLHFDLNNQRPNIYASYDFPQIKKGQPKPIVLFLKAHMKGAQLTAVTYDPQWKRVLVFHFGDCGTAELRLFPHGPNLIVVNKEGKQVSWAKVKDLKPSESSQFTESDVEGSEVTLFHEPKQKIAQAKTQNSASVEKKRAKLELAIHKIENDIHEKEKLDFSEIGEWIKANDLSQAPNHWAEYIDLRKTKAQNMEALFAKAKSNKLKIIGAKKRIQELQDELEKLKESNLGSDIQAHSDLQNPPLPSSRLRFKDSQISARTFDIGNDISLVVGKSAKDNLRILRESKSWHLWIHLRDYPGAHGILTFNKGRRVSDHEIHQAAEHLLRVQFGQKAPGRKGERFDLLVTECRFVSPIRGDRHGRVTHANARTLRHEFQNLNS